MYMWARGRPRKSYQCDWKQENLLGRENELYQMLLLDQVRSEMRLGFNNIISSITH